MSKNRSIVSKHTHIDNRSTSTPISSSIVSSTPEEYNLTDVAFVLGNLNYLREIQYTPFLSKNTYTDERILVSIRDHPYGRMNRTFLQYACLRGKIERVKSLIRCNANPDISYTKEISEAFGMKECDKIHRR